MTKEANSQLASLEEDILWNCNNANCAKFMHFAAGSGSYTVLHGPAPHIQVHKLRPFGARYYLGRRLHLYSITPTAHACALPPPLVF